jgi:hypothetical protein
MKERTLPFFQGVMLVARQALPASVSQLRQDARTLTEIWSPTGLRAGAPLGVGTNAIVLADTWLKFREGSPSGPLADDVIQAVRSIPTSRSIGMASAAESFGGLPKTPIAARAQDNRFVELFTGTLAGLECVRPEIPHDILSGDLKAVIPAYREVRLRYKDTGVPEAMSRLLFVDDFISFRLANPFRRFMPPPQRFGALKVSTQPDTASVYVDQSLWGTSTVQMGVPAGTHRVEAKKGKLSGQQDVVVLAASMIQVTLALS